MLTATQIKTMEFSKTTTGAYKAQEVEEFLSSVAADYDKMFKDNAQLTQKLQILADKIEEYRKEEENIHVVLLAAQKMSGSMTQEAQDKKASIMAEAKEQSEALLNDAREKSEKMLADTRAEQQEMVEQNRLKMASLTQEYDRLKREVGNFRETLRSLYASHLELISALPEYREPTPAAEPTQKEAEPAETPQAIEEPAPEEEQAPEPEADIPEPAPEIQEPAPVIRWGDAAASAALGPVSGGRKAEEKNGFNFNINAIDEELENGGGKEPGAGSNLKFGDSYNIDEDDED